MMGDILDNLVKSVEKALRIKFSDVKVYTGIPFFGYTVLHIKLSVGVYKVHYQFRVPIDPSKLAGSKPVNIKSKVSIVTKRWIDFGDAVKGATQHIVEVGKYIEQALEQVFTAIGTAIDVSAVV